MIGWGLIACGVGIIIAALLLVRFAKLPPWTHRDLLAFLALVATIGGAMVLTLLKWLQSEKFNEQSDRLIAELVRERPNLISPEVGQALTTIIDSLTWDLKLTSVGIIVVLLSLGLVISARTLKGKILGAEFDMATGDPIPVKVEQPKSEPVPVAPQPPPAAPAVDAAPSSRK